MVVERVSIISAPHDACVSLILRRTTSSVTKGRSRAGSSEIVLKDRSQYFSHVYMESVRTHLKINNVVHARAVFLCCSHRKSPMTYA